jgi:hypothetical protein
MGVPLSSVFFVYLAIALTSLIQYFLENREQGYKLMPGGSRNADRYPPSPPRSLAAGNHAAL